jgi:hypothetical protein
MSCAWGKLMRCGIRLVIGALAAAAVASAGACSQTETSITGPSASGDRCQVAATSAPPMFPPPGGQGAVTITTTRDCTWSIATDAAWVAIGGSRTGQGDATVVFTVSANPAPASRSAAILVAGQSVAVSQQAAPCVFSLSRTGDTVGADGGRLAVGVTTLNGCRWTSATAAGWIAISSGSSGDGTGTVGLSIAANAGAARVGQVNVAGQTYTVGQNAAAAPPPPGPNPNPAPPPSPPPPGAATHVSFEGTIANLGGRCPNLTFSVGGTTVVTDGSTNYAKKTKCDDVRNGRAISGEGDVQPNGTVKATMLEVNGDDH